MSKERARLDMACMSQELIIIALRKQAKELERAELARCAEECEKQSEYEGGLLDRIAELENPWISVEDRLPDEIQSVLSFASRDGVFQSDYRAGNFKKSLVVWEHLNVTHWMPLPEPPKEQVK